MNRIPSYFWEAEKNNLLDIPEPRCMICGELSDNVEFLITNDDESFCGVEMWSYCDKCKIDTFHKIHLKNK